MLNNRLQATDYRPEISVQKNYGQLPQVDCYPGQINQVLMSVLSNALDAIDGYWLEAGTPKGPEKGAERPLISLSAQAFVDTVQITIADNGPGMPDEVKARLYDPFFTTKPVGQGTGLGLAMSYQIIAKHGGTLQCRSQLGQGAQFVISLPN